MCNPRRRILNLIDKEISISRAEIFTKSASKKTTTIISWLINNSYIKPDPINPEKVHLTKKGDTYRRKLNKEFFLKVGLFLTLLSGVVVPIVKNAHPEPDTTNYVLINSDSLVTKKIDSTFYLANYSSLKNLVSTIEKKSFYFFSMNSQNYLEIKYSGDYLSIRDNYYVYPGGFIVIIYNHSKLYNMEHLYIEKTLQDGTLLPELTRELQRRINIAVNSDLDSISNVIIYLLNSKNGIIK